MKQIIPNYTFSAAGQSIVLDDYTSPRIQGFLIVINLNTNTVIYNMAKPGLGGAIDGNGLILECDTTSMGDFDPLFIAYDVQDGEPSYDASLDITSTSMEAILSAIYGHVDGLETAVGSTNTALTDVLSELGVIDGHIVSTNTKLDTVHTDLTSIDGHIDGLETAVASTNTKLDTVHTDLGSIDGHIDGLETATGTTTDAAVVTDSDGSIIAFLRGIVKMFSSRTAKVDVAGDVASGSTDSGNPIKVGFIGHTTAPTAVTDGQRVGGISDKVGKQVVVGSIRDLKANQATTITSSVDETTIVTSVASTFLDLYGLIITNTSAGGTKVTIKDATSGTTRITYQVPAYSTVGFMLPESAAVKQSSAGNNWTATCGSSVASIEISAFTVQNI